MRSLRQGRRVAPAGAGCRSAHAASSHAAPPRVLLPAALPVMRATLPGVRPWISLGSQGRKPHSSPAAGLNRTKGAISGPATRCHLKSFPTGERCSIWRHMNIYDSRDWDFAYVALSVNFPAVATHPLTALHAARPTHSYQLLTHVLALKQLLLVISGLNPSMPLVNALDLAHHNVSPYCRLQSLRAAGVGHRCASDIARTSAARAGNHKVSTGELPFPREVGSNLQY
jgi:hypothetical protein